MLNEFEDEKGKRFTEVVTKRKVPALVQTISHLVHGNIHIRPDERLKDELDRDELFLAITEAKILDADGKVIHQTDFLAIRRAQIIWVMPADGETEK